MKANGWKKIIEDANQSEKQMKLLAQHLADADRAKQELRDKGYGWGGLNIFETTRMVPNIKDVEVDPTF